MENSKKKHDLKHAIKEMFKTHDTSAVSDGLSLEEWTDMVKEKFPDVSESDIKMEYQKADKNSNELVTIKEFKKYMKKVMK